MDLGITGRTALVLGASGGLGSAIAVRLAEEGANVAAAGRSADKLADTVKRIQAAGVKALPLTWDLGDLDSVDTHVSEIENTLGPVDILVNNTGGPPPTPAAGQDAATWRTSFEQMILSVIVITDRVLPGMRERGWGRILTSTSGGALSPIPNLAISNTLRASLHTWSKTLSDEVGRDGVTSNIIVPGRIQTARTTIPRRTQGGPRRYERTTMRWPPVRRRWRSAATADPRSTPTSRRSCAASARRM